MDVVLASSAASSSWPNEDFVGATPFAVVLLDGAGITGIESICRHGTAWYSHSLGAALLGRLSRDDGRDLVSILGDGIEQIAEQHRFSCDIADPSSPQATVMMLRVSEEHSDYLALGDSFLILDRASGDAEVITDEREVAVRRQCSAVLAGVAEGSGEYVRTREAYIDMLRARRNQAGGYWIAKDDPHAAQQALTGSVDTRDILGTGLLSNGASRIVTTYGLADWREVLHMFRTGGPLEVIRRVRRAEATRPGADQVPDDATIAYCSGFMTARTD